MTALSEFCFAFIDFLIINMPLNVVDLLVEELCLFPEDVKLLTVKGKWSDSSDNSELATMEWKNHNRIFLMSFQFL